MYKTLEQAELHIGFGYDSSSDKTMPDWEKEGAAKWQINEEIALKKEIDDRLFIYEFDNHYKSLVKDNDYFLAVSSFNWLSNSKGKNFERAWKNEFSELAEKEFDGVCCYYAAQKSSSPKKIAKTVFRISEVDNLHIIFGQFAHEALEKIPPELTSGGIEDYLDGRHR